MKTLFKIALAFGAGYFLASVNASNSAPKATEKESVLNQLKAVAGEHFAEFEEHIRTVLNNMSEERVKEIFNEISAGTPVKEVAAKYFDVQL